MINFPLKSISALILLTIFNNSSLYAQERYKITYDYKTEQITYLSLDKNNIVKDTLAQPKLKRNSLVELQLKNVNPFAVKVETNVKEENLIQAGQGFNFSSLLGGINSFTGNNLNLNTANLPETGLFSSEKGTRGIDAAQNAVEDINTTMTTIDALKTTLLSNLVNPNLSKFAIKENLVYAADAEQDVRLPSAGDNFYVYLSKLKKSLEDSKSQVSSAINQLADEMEQSTSEATALSRGELIRRNATISTLENMLNTLDQSTLQSLSNIEELKSLYTLLEASNFEQTYDYELSADKVNIELKFIQSDFSNMLDNDDEANTVRTRNIKIFSKGGFKINTSVALTLNNFGSKSNDYFIDDSSVIGADENNFFVPNLSTLINFYPFMGENFNVGGSFGLSVPISGTGDINGINFLFGPSLFFGSKSRLSLSGGLAYGPVKKLTNGLEVGDTTSFSSIDNFTRNVYDFGYYFGVSFSIFDLK